MIAPLFLSIGFLFKSKKVVRKNISHALGNIPEDQITSIIEFMWKNYAYTFVEYLYLYKFRLNKFSAPQIKISGKKILDDLIKSNKQAIFISGHFGNFELFSWLRLAAPSVRQWITTYRGLRQRKLTKLLLDLRKASGVLYLERRAQGPQIKKAMEHPGVVLGLVADQHAGASGIRLPVFDRIASVNPAPAIMAKRYNCRLFPTACFRTSLGRWKIELGNEIPIRTNGKRRSTKDITLDIIAAHEEYIRRDPANWFWVHNLWKPNPKVDG